MRNASIHAGRVLLWVLALVAAEALVAGCGTTTEVRTETVPVLTPVPVQAPAPDVPDRPVLPITQVDSAASHDAVIRAYVASIVLLQGYAEQLERLLDAYTPDSDTTQPPDD